MPVRLLDKYIVKAIQFTTILSMVIKANALSAILLPQSFPGLISVLIAKESRAKKSRVKAVVPRKLCKKRRAKIIVRRKSCQRSRAVEKRQKEKQ